MDSIFESSSERENFYKLRRQWDDGYRVYPNLNFLNVYKPDKIRKRLTLTDNQFEFLKKTDVDYTLCDWGDKPVVCIEFDGIQKGFSVGLKYNSSEQKIPLRKKNFEMKLKIAKELSIPLFVVSPQQFNNIATGVKLTIVDGIVSHAIAIRKFEASLKKYALTTRNFGSSVNDFAQLDLHSKKFAVLKYFNFEPPDDLCTNKILGQHDPFVKKIRELREQVNQSGDRWKITHKLVPNTTPILVRSKCVIQSLSYFNNQEFVGEVSIPKFGDCDPPDIQHRGNDLEATARWLESLAGLNTLEYSFIVNRISKIIAWNSYVEKLKMLSGIRN